MKKHKISLIAVLTGIGLVAAGCGSTGGSGSASNGTSDASTPTQGGELVVAALPSTLDPHATTSRSNWVVAASVCEGLFANAANTEVSEGLAESYTYDEATRTYTVKLREGVNFHGGATLDSGDVVASLLRFSEGDAGKVFANLVESISAVDANTVEIKTNTPTGAIPALLATPDTGAYILSEESIEAAGDAELTSLDCTGPYKLENFKVDAEAITSRFDNYASRTEPADGATGEKVAYADTLRFVPLNEDNVLNQLRTGQVNVAPQFVSMDQLSVYESDPALEPIVSGGAGFSLLQFNLKQGPFTNPDLRAAVLNAVDAEEIAIQQLGSAEYFENTSSFFPDGNPWYSEAGAEVWENRSPERARELLQRAGYDNTPIRILYRLSTDNYGPLLAQQLEAVGFTVELQNVDAATFGATRKDESAWDIFLAGGTAYSDPLTVVFLNDDFPGWWTTEQKTALMNSLTEGATFEERKPVWDEMQQLIWEELPFVKLGHEPRLVVTSSDIVGLKPSQGTVRGYYNVGFAG